MDNNEYDENDWLYDAYIEGYWHEIDNNDASSENSANDDGIAFSFTVDEEGNIHIEETDDEVLNAERRQFIERMQREQSDDENWDIEMQDSEDEQNKDPNESHRKYRRFNM
jgi:hypothetical protein